MNKQREDGEEHANHYINKFLFSFLVSRLADFDLGGLIHVFLRFRDYSRAIISVCTLKRLLKGKQGYQQQLRELSSMSDSY